MQLQGPGTYICNCRDLYMQLQVPIYAAAGSWDLYMQLQVPIYVEIIVNNSLTVISEVSSLVGNSVL